VREIKKEKERGVGREWERHQVIFEIYILKRERIIIFHYVCLSSLQNWQHFQIRFFSQVVSGTKAQDSFSGTDGCFSFRQKISDMKKTNYYFRFISWETPISMIRSFTLNYNIFQLDLV
jgi:hypothetical protein